MSTETRQIVPAGVQIRLASEARRIQIDDLLAAWLESLTSETTSSYGADLEHFRGWIGADTLADAMQTLFSMSTPEANALVLRYRRHLQVVPVFSGVVAVATGVPDRTGYSAATINRRLSALRSVASIARTTGLFHGHIEIRGVPSTPTLDTAGIGAEAYHLILRKLDQKERSSKLKPRRRWELVRDRAILRLLHDMALRRVEVVRLDLDDVQFEGDEPALVIQPKGHRGARDRLLVPRLVVDAIKDWIEVRGKHPGALFHARGPAHEGVTMSLSTINRICQRRGAQAGVVKRCRPHGLRHTAITTGLDRTNGDIRSVAQLARHRNPSTTMRYDDRRKRASRDLSDLIGTET